MAGLEVEVGAATVAFVTKGILIVRVRLSRDVSLCEELALFMLAAFQKTNTFQ
jgi:hypothetical protein